MTSALSTTKGIQALESAFNAQIEANAAAKGEIQTRFGTIGVVVLQAKAYILGLLLKRMTGMDVQTALLEAKKVIDLDLKERLDNGENRIDPTQKHTFLTNLGYFEGANETDKYKIYKSVATLFYRAQQDLGKSTADKKLEMYPVIKKQIDETITAVPLADIASVACEEPGFYTEVSRLVHNHGGDSLSEQLNEKQVKASIEAISKKVEEVKRFIESHGGLEKYQDQIYQILSSSSGGLDSRRNFILALACLSLVTENQNTDSNSIIRNSVNRFFISATGAQFIKPFSEYIVKKDTKLNPVLIQPELRTANLPFNILRTACTKELERAKYEKEHPYSEPKFSKIQPDEKKRLVNLLQTTVNGNNNQLSDLILTIYAIYSSEFAADKFRDLTTRQPHLLLKEILQSVKIDEQAISNLENTGMKPQYLDFFNWLRTSDLNDDIWPVPIIK